MSQQKGRNGIRRKVRTAAVARSFLRKSFGMKEHQKTSLVLLQTSATLCTLFFSLVWIRLLVHDIFNCPLGPWGAWGKCRGLSYHPSIKCGWQNTLLHHHCHFLSKDLPAGQGKGETKHHCWEVMSHLRPAEQLFRKVLPLLQFNNSTRDWRTFFWVWQPSKRPSSLALPPTMPGLCTSVQQYNSLGYSAKWVADASAVNLPLVVCFRKKWSGKVCFIGFYQPQKTAWNHEVKRKRSPENSGASLSQHDFPISSTQLKGCLKPTFLGTKKILFQSSLIIEMWLKPSIFRTAKNK